MSQPRHDVLGLAFRVSLAVSGVLAGVFWTSGSASHALLLGSLAYAAWTTGISIGVGLAVITGALRLAHTEQRPSGHLVAVAVLWTVLYLVTVMISAGIETRTRPNREGDL